jgi:hypothetical protein
MKLGVNHGLLLMGLFGVTLGCAEQRSTFEPSGLRPKTPSMMIVPPSVSDQTLTVPGAGTTPANTRSLPTYDDALIVQFQIDGGVSRVQLKFG